ncbi:MAG: hypothetical protein WAW96_18330 [Alphaproteobacteria bacterium]
MRITLKRPNECQQSELEEFVDLVRLGREVQRNGLESRVEHAWCLAFVRQRNVLQACGGVKVPDPGRRQKYFTAAAISDDADKYRLELGWVFVVPSLRGLGIADDMTRKLVEFVDGEALYATSAAANKPMHRILSGAGFSTNEKGFRLNGDRDLWLFVRPSA